VTVVGIGASAGGLAALREFFRNVADDSEPRLPMACGWATRGRFHMDKVRITLVEDHAVLRDILVEYIGGLPQVGSCTAVATAEQALEELEASSPDYLFVDLSLPGMSGIELVEELGKRRPGLKCAILSGHKSRNYVGKAFAAGAKAYMLKGDPLEIERGLEAMRAGRRYVSENLEQPY
jgi:DNA-binding NarL/FixJ family response regulator